MKKKRRIDKNKHASGHTNIIRPIYKRINFIPILQNKNTSKRSELLNIDVTGPASCCAKSFTIHGGILSGPGELCMNGDNDSCL